MYQVFSVIYLENATGPISQMQQWKSLGLPIRDYDIFGHDRLLLPAFRTLGQILVFLCSLFQTNHQ